MVALTHPDTQLAGGLFETCHLTSINPKHVPMYCRISAIKSERPRLSQCSPWINVLAVVSTIRHFGRGESWTERCGECGGTGESLVHHPVRLAVPAGVSDGATFRFRVTSPLTGSVRVEVRVAIQPSLV